MPESEPIPLDPSEKEVSILMEQIMRAQKKREEHLTAVESLDDFIAKKSKQLRQLLEE